MEKLKQKSKIGKSFFDVLGGDEGIERILQEITNQSQLNRLCQVYFMHNPEEHKHFDYAPPQNIIENNSLQQPISKSPNNSKYKNNNIINNIQLESQKSKLYLQKCESRILQQNSLNTFQDSPLHRERDAQQDNIMKMQSNLSKHIIQNDQFLEDSGQQNDIFSSNSNMMGSTNGYQLQQQQQNIKISQNSNGKAKECLFGHGLDMIRTWFYWYFTEFDIWSMEDLFASVQVYFIANSVITQWSPLLKFALQALQYEQWIVESVHQHYEQYFFQIFSQKELLNQ